MPINECETRALASEDILTAILVTSKSTTAYKQAQMSDLKSDSKSATLNFQTTRIVSNNDMNGHRGQYGLQTPPEDKSDLRFEKERFVIIIFLCILPIIVKKQKIVKDCSKRLQSRAPKKLAIRNLRIGLSPAYSYLS